MSERTRGDLLLVEPPLAHVRASDAILAAVGMDSGRVSLGMLVAALGDRGFGIAILVLALPNCIFAPPGLGTITGLLIAVLAAQMMLGHEYPRLPAFLERRSIDRAALRKVIVTALPAVRGAERYARPRLRQLVTGRAERSLGGFMMVQALVVALPFPLTNWLPGVALAIVAVGLIERDGAAVLAGGIVGIAALLLALSVVGGLLAATAFFLGFTS